MFRLNGFGEVDCAATPNDPVCKAFYDPGPSSLPPTGGNVPIATRAQNLIASVANQQFMPVATQTQPGTTVTTLVPVGSPWYKTWWGLLGIAGAGYVGYKYLIAPPKKPSAPAASGAVSGLFGPMRKIRRRIKKMFR